MNTITIAPRALVLNPDTRPHARQYHWLEIPGTSNPVLVICVCEFTDPADEDAWIGRPTVFSLGEIMALRALDAELVTKLAPLGAVDGDTPLAFLSRLKQQWPAARPWFL